MLDLSIDPELNADDPNNYDGLPGEWQVYYPDSDDSVCTIDVTPETI